MEQALAAATWRDYLELTKPKVVALMLLTAVIGMCMAVPGFVPWQALVFGNLGIALCAGSAAAVNHLVDQRIDQVMARTSNRPLAKGRVGTAQAMAFALVLGLAGMVLLLVYVNALTAWLTLASLLGYALVYTVFLKRATPQNIVIGGLAGAAPPLLGQHSRAALTFAGFDDQEAEALAGIVRQVLSQRHIQLWRPHAAYCITIRIPLNDRVAFGIGNHGNGPTGRRLSHATHP